MKRFVFAVIVAIFSSSCGGGGGGGGDGASTGNDSTGVRVLHGALDLSPLTVLGTREPIQSAFRGDAFFRSVAEGAASIVLHRLNRPGQIIFQPSVNASESRQTILVFGQSGDDSLSVRVINESIPEIEDGMAAVRIVNSVHDTETVFLTVNGISTADVSEGRLSDYIMVPSGDLPFRVTESGDDGPFLSGRSLFENRRAYTLFVAGEDGLFATQKFYIDN